MLGHFEEALSAFQGVTAVVDDPITAVLLHFPCLISLSQIISSKDAALYAALAAMAILPKRSNDETVDVPPIVDYLPLARSRNWFFSLIIPPLREALLHLHNCEYHSALQFLEQAQSRLKLDPFLASISGTVLDSVKRRVVVEVRLSTD